jgi:hypothetical protein
MQRNSLEENKNHYNRGIGRRCNTFRYVAFWIVYPHSREQEIITEYSHYSYTIGDPFIIIDPYGFNPLSALILFETDRACEVEVTIKGDSDYTTFTYTQAVEPPRAEIPIVGLYAGRTNNVTLTIGGVSYDYAITTGVIEEGTELYPA